MLNPLASNSGHYCIFLFLFPNWVLFVSLFLFAHLPIQALQRARQNLVVMTYHKTLSDPRGSHIGYLMKIAEYVVDILLNFESSVGLGF